MRQCKYEGHTHHQSRQNAITPTSHLFLETVETSCESQLSHQLYANTSDVLFGLLSQIQVFSTKDRVQKTGWNPGWLLCLCFFFFYFFQPLKLNVVHDTRQQFIYASYALALLCTLLCGLDVSVIIMLLDSHITY